LFIVAAAALFLGPRTALADPPILHDNFGGTFSDNVCGIPVTGNDHGVITIHSVPNNPDAIRITQSGATTFTNASGQSIKQNGSGQTLEVVTSNPDGTITVTDTTIGNPERLSAPGGGTLSRDSGKVTFVTVLDPSTDPPTVISQTVEGVAGPHPDAGGPIYCDVVTGVLGQP
jgi:hypothetical protein